MKDKTNLSWQRIIGSLIDGFATKAIAAGIAIWIAVEAYSFITSSLAPVVAALGGTQ